MATLKERISALQEKNDDLKADVTDLQDKNDKLTKENTESNAQIAVLTEKVAARDKTVKEQETEIAGLKKETETLKDEIAEKMITVKDQEDEITRLTEEQAVLTAENEALQEEIDRINGKPVELYARTNEDKVRLRKEPDVTGYRIRELDKGQYVYVLKQVINQKGETWAAVLADGQTGYIMLQYLDLLPQEESNAYLTDHPPEETKPAERQKRKNTAPTPVPAPTPAPGGTEDSVG